MNYLLATFACLLTTSLLAQKTIDVDKVDGMPNNSFFSVGSEPFVNTKFVRLTEGSPYFKEDWMKGVGFDAAGNRYKPSPVKMDLYDQQVHYLDSAGTEIIASTALKQIVLTDSTTGKTYHFVHSSLFPKAPPRQGWFLQLASGKVAFYQYFVKKATEIQPYNSATKEQQIMTLSEFYLVKPNEILQVKKAKDLPALLPDKQKEMEGWLQTANNKGQSLAEQLAIVVMHYNELQ